MPCVFRPPPKPEHVPRASSAYVCRHTIAVCSSCSGTEQQKDKPGAQRLQSGRWVERRACGIAAPIAFATSACSGRCTTDAPGSASAHSAAPPPTTMTGTSSALPSTRVNVGLHSCHASTLQVNEQKRVRGRVSLYDVNGHSLKHATR